MKKRSKDAKASFLLGKKTGRETQKRQVSAWRRDKRLHDSDSQKNEKEKEMLPTTNEKKC